MNDLRFCFVTDW